MSWWYTLNTEAMDGEGNVVQNAEGSTTTVTQGLQVPGGVLVRTMLVDGDLAMVFVPGVILAETDVEDLYKLESADG